MKNILSVLLFFLYFGMAQAQNPMFIKGEVSEVQVYKDAAELYGSADVQLPKGNSEVVVYNVAETLNKKTLQIGVNKKGITVLSSQFTNNYTSNFKLDETHPRIKELTDSIKIVERLISDSNIDLQSTNKTLELLDKNQTVLVGSNSSNVTQLKELTNYYKSERTKLNQDLVRIQKENTDLNKKLGRLQNSLQVNSDLKEQNSNGVLILKVMTESPVQVKFDINYLADEVYWSPFYEVKGEDLGQPLNIMLKAKVNQDTGVDWRNVQLSLIDGNSSRNNNAPALDPWFLYAYKKEDNRPVGRVDKALHNRAAGIQVESSVSGELSAVTVVGYSQSENQLNTSYETPIPYDILSNGEDYIVNLKQTKVPATYHYYAVPALNLNAYLVAKVKDFNQYQLSPAPATVIFENTYVGETQLNPDIEENELLLTLGNDRKVNIKKEKIESLNTKKMLSSKQEQIVTYDFVIRNNKTKSIEMEVRDRYPLSQDSSVKIELLEKSGAQEDKEKGYLTWNVKINPNETKKIRVSYKVTYPKDFVISGLE